MRKIRRRLKHAIGLFLLGLVFVFVVIECGMRVLCAVSMMKKDALNSKALELEDTVRILCLGDSMTHNQYPLFLENALKDIDASVKFSIFDEGNAGSNTNQLVARVPELLKRYDPDFVVCMMGCNDDDEDQILDYGDVRSPGLLKWMRRLQSLSLFYMLWWNFNQENVAAWQDDTVSRADELRRRKLDVLIDREPGNAAAHFELANLLANVGMNDKALEHWRHAQKLEPENINVYGNLVTFCPQEEKSKWIDIALGLEQSRGIDAQQISAGLIRVGRFDEALALALRGIEKNKKSAELYSLAAFACRRRKDYRRAHEILKQGLVQCPGELVLVRAVNQLYLMKLVSPDPELEKQIYSDTAYNLAVLDRNYARLADLVAGHGAVLVAVQYPTLDLFALEQMLAGRDNICFVDNQQRFVDVVLREGFGAVFIDNFGGSFGHCTDYGNRLLASGIARVVIDWINNHKN